MKFQFHKVRLKAVEKCSVDDSDAFQFHKVRLKANLVTPVTLPGVFQFHKVRLKGRKYMKYPLEILVSIP